MVLNSIGFIVRLLIGLLIGFLVEFLIGTLMEFFCIKYIARNYIE